MSLALVGTGTSRKDITTAATTVIRTTPGRLAQIVVWNVGVGATIDAYDDPATTNNHCWSWATADGKNTWAMQYPMLNGITIVSAGGTPASFSVVYA